MAEIKAVFTSELRGRRGYKVTINGIEPTYHQTREEALWAIRLRGQKIGVANGNV